MLTTTAKITQLCFYSVGLKSSCIMLSLKQCLAGQTTKFERGSTKYLSRENHLTTVFSCRESLLDYGSGT